ncbi:MAG: hypothetical protein EKK29_07030 [Hyphomicrobiales bacterium]|nr:MAG: hypothetical protein EKK29_07030 [Hyphomicrobiales bacterium]
MTTLLDPRPQNAPKDAQGRPLARDERIAPTEVAANLKIARAALDAFMSGHETRDDLGVLRNAALSGNLRFVQRRGGKKAIDDRIPLLEVALHVESGASAERAGLLVGRSIAGHSPEANGRRLARKYRDQIRAQISSHKND